MSTAGTTRRRTKILFKSILCGANVATILILWGICLSTGLEPSVHPRLAQAGLLFPVFLSLNLAFAIVWLVTSWKWIILPLVGLLVCIGNILDYCPLNFSKEIPDSTITVLSYNTGCLAKNEYQLYDGAWTSEYIEKCNADIICLQECPTGYEPGKSLVEKMDSLGYNRREHGGKIIFTKWQFIGDAVFESNGGGNGFMGWHITNGQDTLLIINTHLQSNHISPEEKEEYNSAIDGTDGNMIEDSGRILLSKLSKSATIRQQQVDTLCLLLNEYKNERIILCGDLNETPISYTCRRFSRHLDNAFRQSGFGVGVSFNQKGFPVRIDHIFISHNLESYSTHIDRSVYSSDHFPILTHVRSISK